MAIAFVGSVGRKFLLLQIMGVLSIVFICVYMTEFAGKRSPVPKLQVWWENGVIGSFALSSSYASVSNHQSLKHQWLRNQPLGDQSLGYQSPNGQSLVSHSFDNQAFDDKLIQLLGSITNPRIVHTILTDEFGMAHYLSLKSMMRHVRPSLLYIHVSNLSASIPQPYQTDLFKQYRNIEMVEYPFREKNAVWDMDSIRNQIGEGIYLQCGLLLRPSIERLLRENDCLVDCKLSIIVVNPSCPHYHRLDLSGNFTRCLVSDDPTNISAAALAIPASLYSKIATYLYVPSIGVEAGELGPWHQPLWQAYCNCEQFEPIRHPHAVIPWIAHYVWFGDSTWNMTFMQLIGALSNLKINNVKRVVIHSNVPPTGPHWEWLQQHYGDRIIRLFQPEPKFIYGKQISPYWRQHGADVARLMVLQRFGGMYFDWDAIVMKSHEEFRYYDAVMGLDVSEIGLANGQMMFSSTSQFLKMYFDNYINYNQERWADASILAPMQLYLNTPHLVKVPRNFMDSRFDAPLIQLYNETTEYNTTAFYSFHPCYPKPEVYFNFEITFATASAMNCSLGSLLRHVINYPDFFHK